MRVLFSSTANEGHFGPLVGLARAAVAAGHDVRVAAPGSFAPAVARAGFAHVAFADAQPELIGPVMARLPTLSFEDANTTVVQEVFGRIGAQAALPGLTSLLREWRPHVVVRESAELGSLAAAEAAGVPHVEMCIGMTEMSRLLIAAVPDALVELAGVAGLPAGRLVEAVAEETSLSLVPVALDQAGDDGFAGDPVALRFRDDRDGNPPAGLPAWGDPELPLVYVTFGSVTGTLAPFAGVFRQALDGLDGLPARVFLTVGRAVDTGTLGTLPGNTRVENWWPQSDVLAEASLVLGHGGFGTTMGAVVAGVPQVVAPIFTTDQVINGRHVAAAGIGRTVPPGPDVVVRACREVAAVLAEPDRSSRAQALAAATAALPSAAEAVDFLEARSRS